jgi:non-heme chloroperoxidase
MTDAGSSALPSAKTITEHELEQCEHANQSGRTPVVFVHGLWLLPSSWDRWAELFEQQGFAALAPGWPDDPETVEEAKAYPGVFAGKSVGQWPTTSRRSFAGWTASRRSSATPSAGC